MHAGGGTNDCGEKRNILIVSILLLIGSNLTLRSNMQRAIEVLWVCEQTVLLHVAGRPKPVMGDAEVEDQTPAPGLISKIVADLDVAAPGTREEPGTFTQGAPVFPGSSRLGIEPKTPGWLVQDVT